MPSPAQRHKMKVQAAQQAKAETPAATGREASQYELMKGQLAQHQRDLKKVKSVERKAEVKRGYLEEYRPYVEGVLEGNSGEQDDVLTRVMVWAIDAGDLDLALTLAEYVIEHGLSLPEPFKRDATDAITEEIAELALRETDKAQDYFEALERVESMTEHLDMVDEVRAKLHKALGYASIEAKDLAVSHFERALKLDPRAGVKKLTDKLRKEIGELPAE